MHRVSAAASGFSPTSPGLDRAVPGGSGRIAAALLVVMTSLPVFAQEPSAPQVPSIVTSGEAILRRAPDQAVIYAAVETRARNPRDAQRQNADIMTAVLKRIADAGIAKDAVRTTGYSAQQEFDYSNG